MESNTEIHTDNVCRACMKEASNMSNLFDKDEPSLSLSKTLSFITNMTVREDDKLPKLVCKDCVTLINQADAFKRLCLETEKKFIKLLNQDFGRHTSDSTTESKVQPILDTTERTEKPPIKAENSVDLGNPCSLPYQCSFCGVKFGDIGDLASHVATHDGIVNKDCMESRNLPEKGCLKGPPLTDSKANLFSANSDDIVDAINTNKLVKVEMAELDDNMYSNDFDNDTFLEPPLKVKKKKRKIHLCIKCYSEFESRKDLHHHYLQHHPHNIYKKKKVKKELEPDLCEDDKSISQILKEAKESKRHVCFICDYNCGSKNSLMRHQNKKHPGKLTEFIRDLFENEEKHTEELKTIIEKKEIRKPIRTLECDHCMRKFVKRTTLVAHLKRHNDPATSHICSICKREFIYRAHLDNHMITVHTASNGLKCHVCPKSFSTQEGLDIHKATHESDKRHRCEVCSKSFNMLSTLRDHLRTHTGEKPFLCPVCGKGFSQNTNLQEHLRRHQGIKPYKCELCEMGFVAKGELSAHMRKHSGAHPFVCDDCGNGFTTSSSLVKHRRTHTGERPYGCDLCPMRFAASGTLKNHRRTHTGEKPYKCTHCDKAFVQKNDLVAHTRCHTGERPYVCAACGQAFRQGSALKTHLKMHPANEINPMIVYSRKNACHILSAACGQAFRQGSALKTHLKMHPAKEINPMIVYSRKNICHILCTACGQSFRQVRAEDASQDAPGEGD